MRKLSLVAAAFMILPALVFAQPKSQAADPTPSSQAVQPAEHQAAAHVRTYRGQIMDSACAANGSHAMGYKATHTHTPRACTLACIKDGSTAVLFNKTHKTVYQLDDQSEATKFAGENVRVRGTLDPTTKTIHVEHIGRA